MRVSQSLAYDSPCKLLQLQADLLLLFLQIQLYNGLGALSGVNTLGPNDLGVAPAGIGHFIKNAGAALSAVVNCSLCLPNLVIHHSTKAADPGSQQCSLWFLLVSACAAVHFCLWVNIVMLCFRS